MPETESWFRSTLPSRLPCVLYKKVLVRELYRVQKKRNLSSLLFRNRICFSVWGPRSLKCLDYSLPTGLSSDFCFHRQFHRPLDTVSGLLNLSLLYHVWLCGVFVLMTWYVSWLLFKIYATEVSIEFLSVLLCFGPQSFIFGSTLISMLLCPKPFCELGFGFFLRLHKKCVSYNHHLIIVVFVFVFS